MTRTRTTLVLLLACVAQFMLLVDDTITNVALPTIGRDLHFSESSLSWVVNAYLLTFGGLLLVGGRLADRFGPRRMFALSLAGFGVASIISGLAPSAGVLVGARAAQGVCGALLSPAALALLLAASPEGEARRRALAVWAGLLGLGAATGLVAGGALVQAASWRWIFFINAPVAAAALAAIPRVLGADDRAGRRPLPNVGGAALATMSLLVLVYSVVQTDTYAWTSARTLGGLGLALVLGLAFAVSERRSAHPLLPTELLGRRLALRADLVILLAAAGLLAMFFFQTLYLQRVLGFGPLQTGVSFLPFSGAMAIASGLMGRLPERVDVRIPVVIGCLLGASGLWLMSRLTPSSAYSPDVLAALSVTGFGLGLAFVPIIGLGTGDAQARDGGLASGLMTTAQQIGGAVGIAALITIATDRTTHALAGGARPAQALSDGFSAAFSVEVGLLLAAALMALVLLRTRDPARERGRPRERELATGAPGA
ncbi:MAG TPA: MFS transporter [Solirubrobacteraceae bacterium]|nr:MFS transporter [Solirubrobacteraceae bacterium]